jgi:hypothetical protein
MTHSFVFDSSRKRLEMWPAREGGTVGKVSVDAFICLDIGTAIVFLSKNRYINVKVVPRAVFRWRHVESPRGRVSGNHIFLAKNRKVRRWHRGQSPRVRLSRMLFQPSHLPVTRRWQRRFGLPSRKSRNWGHKSLEIAFWGDFSAHNAF